jgi:hypothetical protein
MQAKMASAPWMPSFSSLGSHAATLRCISSSTRRQSPTPTFSGRGRHTRKIEEARTAAFFACIRAARSVSIGQEAVTIQPARTRAFSSASQPAVPL